MERVSDECHAQRQGDNQRQQIVVGRMFRDQQQKGPLDSGQEQTGHVEADVRGVGAQHQSHRMISGKKANESERDPIFENQLA